MLYNVTTIDDKNIPVATLLASAADSPPTATHMGDRSRRAVTAAGGARGVAPGSFMAPSYHSTTSLLL